MKTRNSVTRRRSKGRFIQRSVCLILIVAFWFGSLDQILGELLSNSVRSVTDVIAKEAMPEQKEKTETVNIISNSKASERIRTVITTASGSTIAKTSTEELLAANPAIRNEFQWKQRRKEAEELKKRRIVCDPSDVTKISNLTINEMRIVFKGTWLEGKEQDLYNYEHQYGINVFFIYGVSTLESGHGEFPDAPTAKAANNYYGINLDASWDNWEDCSNYWCDMINRLYVGNGNRSVTDIAPIYCPPRYVAWTKDVSSFMIKMHDRCSNFGVSQEVA